MMMMMMIWYSQPLRGILVIEQFRLMTVRSSVNVEKTSKSHLHRQNYFGI